MLGDSGRQETTALFLYRSEIGSATISSSIMKGNDHTILERGTCFFLPTKGTRVVDDTHKSNA